MLEDERGISSAEPSSKADRSSCYSVSRQHVEGRSGKHDVSRKSKPKEHRRRRGRSHLSPEDMMLVSQLQQSRRCHTATTASKKRHDEEVLLHPCSCRGVQRHSTGGDSFPYPSAFLLFPRTPTPPRLSLTSKLPSSYYTRSDQKIRRSYSLIELSSPVSPLLQPMTANAMELSNPASPPPAPPSSLQRGGNHVAAATLLKRRLVLTTGGGPGGIGVGGPPFSSSASDDTLPKRARWTIILTATILLMMSVVLVGVTLRMAPIIDSMVKKENRESFGGPSREEANLTTTESLQPGTSPSTESTT